MSRLVDLNQLRNLVHQNQTTGDVRPTHPDRVVYVDREGKISLGSDHVAGESSAALSLVPQEIFAADRRQRDWETVSRYLPRNTQFLRTEDGVDGWLFEIETELKDRFSLFGYFDGAFYQVMVISPEVERRWSNPHTGHIFSDGRICFGGNYGHGMPTLRDAYAKAVLWANGFSVATRTGQFPFSTNN